MKSTTKLAVDHSQISSAADSNEWRRWFATSSPKDTDEQSYKDPITEADELFLSVSSHAANANVVAATNGEETTTTTILEGMQITTESPFVTSPPFNQRLLDQQNAAMGIYPTPPDGLLGGHNIVTPTPNVTSDIPSADALHTDRSADLLGSDDAHAQLDDVRGQSFSTEPQGYDLFGDAGMGGFGDEFGGNEVGAEGAE